MLPHLQRTLLIEHDLGVWADGHLPDGVRVAGSTWRCCGRTPATSTASGRTVNEVHVWTANTRADVAWCLSLGVARDHHRRSRPGGRCARPLSRIEAVSCARRSSTLVLVSLARVACVIPARDEADRIAATVTAVSALPGVNIVIVTDDGSGDDTGQRAGAAGAIVVTHTRTRGRAAAIESAVNALGVLEQRDRRPECGTLLLVDADLGDSAVRCAQHLIGPVRHRAMPTSRSAVPPPAPPTGLVATSRRPRHHRTGRLDPPSAVWAALPDPPGLRAGQSAGRRLTAPMSGMTHRHRAAPGCGSGRSTWTSPVDPPMRGSGRAAQAGRALLKDVTRALAARGLVARPRLKDSGESGGCPTSSADEPLGAVAPMNGNSPHHHHHVTGHNPAHPPIQRYAPSVWHRDHRYALGLIIAATVLTLFTGFLGPSVVTLTLGPRDTAAAVVPAGRHRHPNEWLVSVMAWMIILARRRRALGRAPGPRRRLAAQRHASCSVSAPD